MILGTALLIVSLLAALGGALAAFLVIRGDRSALVWSRALTYTALVAVVLASVFLLTLILARRYDVAYVYQYTSNDLDLRYRISAFWAGQEGSFLLWLLLAAILTSLQIRRARQFEPYVLLTLLLVQAGLGLFLLVDSPFRLLDSVPADGFGLNPLLQNPWTAFHPPTLFVGYAGLALPLAYAIAGLWRRDYDAWVRPAMPWTLLGWFFLGLGIYLGAYWAYETLGWGGYWGWDLVENSSLVPWLTGTALVHGLVIQRYRKRLRQGNFILAIITFLLILYATYLTRSGVLSEISTHSFVESGLTPWMVGAMAVATVGSVALLVSRWPDIPRSPVLADTSGKEVPLLEGDVAGSVGRNPRTWLSRDFTFLLTLLVLLLLTAPIWIGTLVPVITGLWGPADALSTDFYPRTTAPSLLLLLAVLSICPLLGWRESSGRRLWRSLLWPAVAALVGTVVALLLGADNPLSWPVILLGLLALGSNALMLVRTLRGDWLRLGGYLAHIGLGLTVVGIIASSVYSVESPTLALVEGEPQEALGHRLTFVGWQESPEDRPALRLEVERDGRRFTALPQLYTNPQDDSTMASPHVQRHLTYDLYIAAEGYEPGDQGEGIALREGTSAPTMGYSLTLQSLREEGLYAQAVLVVEQEGMSITVTPTFPLSDTVPPGRPASLPGGEEVSIEDVYLPPPGLLLLIEDQAIPAGPYTITLQGFSMAMHGVETDTVAASAVIEFVWPEGSRILTPTYIVGPTGTSHPPVELEPGVTVQLVQLAVEERAAWIQVEGAEIPRQIGVVWLRVTSGRPAAGVARVHVSIKPGINLLWTGGLLLLVGTAIAWVRRWRDGLAGGRPLPPR